MTFWPHAPYHYFNEKGTYMVTGSTLHKVPYFKEPAALYLLHDALLRLAKHYEWNLEAWAVFANHYHFIARSPENPISLRKFITHLHASSSRQLNILDATPGRKVWHQYWESRITFQTSYLARLNYVMHNPVKHQLVTCSNQYDWCSANWFEKNVDKAYYNTVKSMPIDNVSVLDDF